MRAITLTLLTAFLMVSGGGVVLAADGYPDALPDNRISKGKKNIAEAWLSHPTTRYTHFVLGSNYEAGQLNVRLKNGKTVSYKLDRNSVFEDRIARLHDLDKDGKDEVIVVRAYLTKGAALSVFSIKNGKLKLVAETPDMGHAFGWLNPAGIADFDGDGIDEIAFVRKPHVLGRLELWQYKNGKITRKRTVSNTSNHAIGSKSLGLSVVADFNGDGTPDLAIPDKNRTTIRFLSFRNGVKEISRKKLTAGAMSDFRKLLRGGKAAVEVGLANGKKVVIEP